MKSLIVLCLVSANWFQAQAATKRKSDSKKPSKSEPSKPATTLKPEPVAEENLAPRAEDSASNASHSKPQSREELEAEIISKNPKLGEEVGARSAPEKPKELFPLPELGDWYQYKPETEQRFQTDFSESNVNLDAYHVSFKDDLLVVVSRPTGCPKWSWTRVFRKVPEAPNKYQQIDDPYKADGIATVESATLIRIENTSIVAICEGRYRHPGRITIRKQPDKPCEAQAEDYADPRAPYTAQRWTEAKEQACLKAREQALTKASSGCDKGFVCEPLGGDPIMDYSLDGKGGREDLTTAVFCKWKIRGRCVRKQ